jgi:hypothetical protein
MTSAAEKDQTGVTHGKLRSRPLYWLAAILLFLFVFLALTSIVPLEFQFGRRTIHIESGLSPTPANRFLEISHAKVGWSSYQYYAETTYTLSAGRSFFSVTVQTKDVADPDTPTTGRP